VGDLHSDIEAEREKYKAAELYLSGLAYFVIDPPDVRYLHHRGKVIIDLGMYGGERTPKMPIPFESLPHGAFAYWIYSSTWNTFMHFAAMDAALRTNNADGSS
jgi:hypothetical protein